MGAVTILLVSSPLATGPTTQLFRKFVSKQKTYGAIFSRVGLSYITSNFVLGAFSFEFWDSSCLSFIYIGCHFKPEL